MTVWVIPAWAARWRVRSARRLCRRGSGCLRSSCGATLAWFDPQRSAPISARNRMLASSRLLFLKRLKFSDQTAFSSTFHGWNPYGPRLVFLGIVRDDRSVGRVENVAMCSTEDVSYGSAGDPSANLTVVVHWLWQGSVFPGNLRLHLTFAEKCRSFGQARHR
jgi:hypothetical protein